jgi:7-cyano-7-deazaguanine synthase
MLKVVSLLSGGADSATLLYYLLTLPDVVEIAPLAINYGQRHKKELDSAKVLVTKLQNLITDHQKQDLRAKLKKVHDLKVVDFPIGTFGGSPLVDLETPVPEQTEGLQATTVVPYRNMLLATLAASYAKSLNFNSIALGPTIEDMPNYPDCRPMFIKSLMDTLRLGDTIHNMAVLVPLIDLNKAEVYSIGKTLNVPYKDTWTCYNGREKACGVCDSCKERIEGFAMIGEKDPLDYEIEIDWKAEQEKYRK